MLMLLALLWLILMILGVSEINRSRDQRLKSLADRLNQTKKQ